MSFISSFLHHDYDKHLLHQMSKELEEAIGMMKKMKKVLLSKWKDEETNSSDTLQKEPNSKVLERPEISGAETQPSATSQR